MKHHFFLNHQYLSNIFHNSTLESCLYFAMMTKPSDLHSMTDWFWCLKQQRSNLVHQYQTAWCLDCFFVCTQVIVLQFNNSLLKNFNWFFTTILAVLLKLHCSMISLVCQKSYFANGIVAVFFKCKVPMSNVISYLLMSRKFWDGTYCQLNNYKVQDAG